MSVKYTSLNNSRGYIVELLDNVDKRCESWLLLPGENLWSEGVRGFIYCLALLYIFMGIALTSDVFMTSIEVITSTRRTVRRWDPGRQCMVEQEVLVWNETVANLTLMALGSSAPEILLSVIETIQNLDQEVDSDGLGTFTIIGSGAFNLLIITAICVLSVPSPEVKIVKELGVFALTSVSSIFAYLWMLVVLQWHTPEYVDVEEAWVTLLFFPVMVVLAYCTDNGWWRYKCCPSSQVQHHEMVRDYNKKIFVHSK